MPNTLPDSPGGASLRVLQPAPDNRAAPPGEADFLSAFDERVRRIAEETFRVMAATGGAADDDQGITVDEAAELIGVQPWRVYELIKRRELPAYKISSQRYRIRLGAVREFVRRQKP